MGEKRIDGSWSVGPKLKEQSQYLIKYGDEKFCKEYNVKTGKKLAQRKYKMKRAGLLPKDYKHDYIHPGPGIPGKKKSIKPYIKKSREPDIMKSRKPRNHEITKSRKKENQEYKKVSFQLKEEQFKKIKLYAVENNKQISQVIRELIEKLK